MTYAALPVVRGFPEARCKRAHRRWRHGCLRGGPARGRDGAADWGRRPSLAGVPFRCRHRGHGVRQACRVALRLPPRVGRGWRAMGPLLLPRYAPFGGVATERRQGVLVGAREGLAGHSSQRSACQSRCTPKVASPGERTRSAPPVGRGSRLFCLRRRAHNRTLTRRACRRPRLTRRAIPVHRCRAGNRQPARPSHGDRGCPD